MAEGSATVDILNVETITDFLADVLRIAERGRAKTGAEVSDELYAALERLKDAAGA